MNDSALACPGCGKAMQALDFERKLGGTMTVDLCQGCRLIWFDRHESLQLSSDGVLELFKLIAAKQDAPVNRIPDVLDCPRCRVPLLLTHDMQRTTRFVYFRCDSGHGKLTAFYQFLREKNFVRGLSPAELLRLKAEVKQVRCSCCGAPIDLATDVVCRYCKSPIAVLDADAMRATLAEVSADVQKRSQAVAGLATAGALMQARAARSEPPHGWDGVWRSAGETVPDLLDLGISLVTDIFGD